MKKKKIGKMKADSRETIKERGRAYCSKRLKSFRNNLINDTDSWGKSRRLEIKESKKMEGFLKFLS